MNDTAPRRVVGIDADGTHGWLGIDIPIGHVPSGRRRADERLFEVRPEVSFCALARETAGGSPSGTERSAAAVGTHMT